MKEVKKTEIEIINFMDDPVDEMSIHSSHDEKQRYSSNKFAISSIMTFLKSRSYDSRFSNL